jgi:DNA-binding transcriptional regulator YdaS (Cro superfamily)
LFVVEVAREVKDKVKEELREEVRDMVNKRLGHIRIQIDELSLVNRIRIIVEGTISKIIVGYAERLGILERNMSQVEGLIREVSATIQHDIERDVEGRVNTYRAVKEIMDETVKTVQGILETLKKKIIEDLEAKIGEALASIKA